MACGVNTWRPAGGTVLDAENPREEWAAEAGASGLITWTHLIQCCSC